MQVSSASEAIDAIGGTSKFAEWWGAEPDTVTAWRRRGFPTRTADKMRERLRKEKQIEVDPSAWGME